MSDEESFDKFLRENVTQFRNLQRAVEIMTAFTAEGFDKAPSQTQVPMDLFRLILDEISNSSSDVVDHARRTGVELGAIVNGFATLTGTVIYELAQATNKDPSEILSSYGSMAALIISEAQQRGFTPDEGN